ncbi:DsrE family protein [Myxococcota bacterium]|nr:DsrE family protein [Myxococcota bacterium]MBU1533808.1 DsrE family protein [Myxococcota bacterium]
MKKIALFAFNGDPMCFVHVLLYAMDFHTKNYDVKLVIEGSATKLVKELSNPDAPFAPMYKKVKEAGLIDAVCIACSKKMGSYESAVAQQLPMDGTLNGHPSLESYVSRGYTIMTF